MGIEPTPSAWKAEVLPLNYTRKTTQAFTINTKLEGVGFEPTKAMPSDLQSDPFDRSGTPPINFLDFAPVKGNCQPIKATCLRNKIKNLNQQKNIEKILVSLMITNFIQKN